MSLSEADLKKYAKLTSQERNNRLRELEAELSSIQCSLKIARQYTDNREYRERRIEGLKEEIQQVREAHARRMAVLERQLKELQEETKDFPAIIKRHAENIKKLSNERALLQNSHLLAEAYKLLQE